MVYVWRVTIPMSGRRKKKLVVRPRNAWTVQIGDVVVLTWFEESEIIEALKDHPVVVRMLYEKNEYQRIVGCPISRNALRFDDYDDDMFTHAVNLISWKSTSSENSTLFVTR